MALPSCLFLLLLLFQPFAYFVFVVKKNEEAKEERNKRVDVHMKRNMIEERARRRGGPTGRRWTGAHGSNRMLSAG